MDNIDIDAHPVFPARKALLDLSRTAVTDHYHLLVDPQDRGGQHAIRQDLDI